MYNIIHVHVIHVLLLIHVYCVHNYSECTYVHVCLCVFTNVHFVVSFCFVLAYFTSENNTLIYIAIHVCTHVQCMLSVCIKSLRPIN